MRISHSEHEGGLNSYHNKQLEFQCRLLCTGYLGFRRTLMLIRDLQSFRCDYTNWSRFRRNGPLIWLHARLSFLGCFRTDLWRRWQGNVQSWLVQLCLTNDSRLYLRSVRRCEVEVLRLWRCIRLQRLLCAVGMVLITFQDDIRHRSARLHLVLVWHDSRPNWKDVLQWGLFRDQVWRGDWP